MRRDSFDRQRFLRVILDAMGLGALAGAAALGCGGNVVVDTAEVGAGGAATTTTTTSGTTTVTSTPSSCNDTGGWGEPTQACLPLQGDACPFEDAPSTLKAIAKMMGVCVDDGTGNCCVQPTAEEVLCALPPGNDQCCYIVLISESGICVGRPFTVGGEARTAPTVRSTWGAARALEAGTPEMDEVTRRAIADGWLRDARLEHASVASFARLALELLAVGAPADLVREAQDAMGDEIRHAELSFAIASAFAGAPLGPGPLAIDGAVGRASLADLAAATAREGCVGETVAAMIAAGQRDAAIHPEARAALASIAEDEAKHAASSWRLVAWALRAGDDDVRAAITRAFDEALAEGVAAPPDAIGADQTLLRANGRLPAAEAQEIAARGVAEVIRPAAAALLS